MCLTFEAVGCSLCDVLLTGEVERQSLSRASSDKEPYEKTPLKTACPSMTMMGQKGEKAFIDQRRVRQITGG